MDTSKTQQDTPHRVLQIGYFTTDTYLTTPIGYFYPRKKNYPVILAAAPYYLVRGALRPIPIPLEACIIPTHPERKAIKVSLALRQEGEEGRPFSVQAGRKTSLFGTKASQSLAEPDPYPYPTFSDAFGAASFYITIPIGHLCTLQITISIGQIRILIRLQYFISHFYERFHSHYQNPYRPPLIS